MKKIFDKLQYYAALIASYPVSYLPAGIRTGLGKFIGYVFMLIFPSRVDIAKDNLSKAFPDKDGDWINQTAKESFENLGITLVEILTLRHISEKKIRDAVKIENPDIGRNLLSQNHGMIFLSAHFGNWEVSALSIALQLDVNFLIIVEHQANDFVNTEMNNIRTRFGNRIVSRYKAAREIVKTLQQGEVLALIADQSASERNDVYVDFFGRPAATFDSPAALALKFNIPIVFGVSVRQDDYSYKLKMQEIKHDDLTNDKEGILELTRRHVKMLEDEIRKHPGHWSWMHRRWKHTPPPEVSDG
jgi:KDO2-lipid IV(A) lauroyltransferase